MVEVSTDILGEATCMVTCLTA